MEQKQIPESEVAIVPPSEVGGLKSEDFLRMNPQGKMPTLAIVEDGFSIPESDTICRYLLSTYKEGPSFLPENPKSNLIARLHDIYLTTIQGCMYKATPPFGTFGCRSAAISEYREQMNIIDDLLVGGDKYLCGDEVSLADATLFPSMVFANYMLPKFGVPENEALPSKIGKWFNDVIESDPAFRKVYDEIMGAFEAWEGRGRWDTIWLAGLRDNEPDTIFDKIIAGEIPAAVVFEDDQVLAFKDINPAAPAHVLVIPKFRRGLSNLRKASNEHIEILGRLLVAAGKIANDTELGFGDGARVVINDGNDGGQEVPHLHVHVLGGRQLTWPPG